jgi:hypothetical protein
MRETLIYSARGIAEVADDQGWVMVPGGQPYSTVAVWSRVGFERKREVQEKYNEYIRY